MFDSFDESALDCAFSSDEELQRALSLLRSETGHDFSLYKSNTITRRIERRIQSLGLDSLRTYVDYLTNNTSEIAVLLDDLLIGVTSFFRDAEAYEALKIHIKQAILTLNNNESYRVWVPACSTGEEAYSLAILIQECLIETRKNVNFQIFASDIDEAAIKIARSGIYSKAQVANISGKRLHQFFTKNNTNYRINRDLREQIVFATQSVIKDPPFTRIDLISCRNLLIYLGGTLQKKLLPLFHYSLKADSILFLGASESVGTFIDLFETLDKKYKIYRQKNVKYKNTSKIKFPISTNLKEGKNDITTENQNVMIKNEVHQPLNELLFQHCLPPCVIADRNGEIIYIHGRLGRFIEPANGLASLNVIDMSRPGLETKLSYAIREINKNNSPMIYRAVNLAPHSNGLKFDLIVKLITEEETDRELIVVTFLERENDSEEIDTNEGHFQDDPRIIELERELKYTKENLQSTIEELKSTNEELQSTNEELQSTNEELETSKEELVTVNSELENRIEELSNTNDDIKNLLDSTNIATIFLDTDFRIKRYTPKANGIIRLIPTDIGRSIFDIVHNLESADLNVFIHEVLETGKSIEKEIQSESSLTYFMRITPYNTSLGQQQGVVMTFEDISEIKRHRDELELLVKQRTSEIEEANNRLMMEHQQRLEAEMELRNYEAKHAQVARLNAVGEIASGIAHEINQPLSNITNYLRGIKQKLNDRSISEEELLSVLTRLEEEVKRSASIVSNIRTLVHRQPINKERISVNEVIEGVAEHSCARISEEGIQIEYFLEQNLPEIYFDKIQFEQVLINLLNNAIDACSKLSIKEKKLRFRTELHDKHLRISVENDGDELQPETVRRMFDLFFTTKSQGLGMGLAISRSIIELYGGNINYISDTDRHNIFRITLPIAS